jgi:hypothetical protein
MERSKVLTATELTEKLKNGSESSGKPPLHMRSGEGTVLKNDKEIFNKCLFIGNTIIWIDLAVAASEGKTSLEKFGYTPTAEQQVPDGFGRIYCSTYI